jgi:hypothetical protein
MEKCARHPERETQFQCMKHGVWMCEECLACRDPEIYCKNRSACPIWYMEKRRMRRQKAEQTAAAAENVHMESEPQRQDNQLLASN